MKRRSCPNLLSASRRLLRLLRRMAGAAVMTYSAAAAGASAAAEARSCDDATFYDVVAETTWVTVDVRPAGGTRGLRDAIRNAHAAYPDRPVRVRLAPGTYADTLGSEIFLQRLLRSAEAPLAVVAADPRPNATVLGHGLNLLHVRHVAIDGLTIGPSQVGPWDGTRHADPQPLQAGAGIQVAGVALNGRANGAPGGVLDPNVYGRFDPSHHIVIRRVTVQNLFGRDEPDAVRAEGHSMDGMKFNQAQDVWVTDSTVVQTSRHGIDNVGVHRGVFCRNLIAENGGGLGIEAKGGSVDVLVEANTFYRVRRVELGGEDTDATYYFSADGRWDYEALRTVVRNNVIVDARESALEFSGCVDCTAIGNTIVFSAAYVPPRNGGDAVRTHDSRILAAAEGAGSDCQTWDPQRQDHVTVNPCWGVGANAPAPVGRALVTRNARVLDNLFVSHAGHWSFGIDAVQPCPLNATPGAQPVAMAGNRWWNAGRGLATEACTAADTPALAAMPLDAVPPDRTSPRTLGASLIDAALPRSTFLGDAAARGVRTGDASAGRADRLGAPRIGAQDPPGAVVSTEPGADRVFALAHRSYPQWFGPGSRSAWLEGWYFRHHAAAQTYIAARAGRLFVLGPDFGPDVVDLGPLAPWLQQARDAGY
jgi:hypothetical protein